MELNRLEHETFEDYFVRLFDNKSVYGLTCEQIGRLLNAEKGVDYTESAWRKEYAAFNRGRNYERGIRHYDVGERILCISDLHVPFQLPIDVFAPYANRADTLVLNGDLSDCQSISSFPKTYRVSPMEELIQTRAYLISLLQLIKPKRVIVNYGNHDLRFQTYFSKNLDSDILELMPKTSLELIFVDGFRHYDKRQMTKTEYEPLCDVMPDIQFDYRDNWFCQIGDAIFAHPIAFSSAMLKTAEKSMLWFRNEGYDFRVMCIGHTHRRGRYDVGNTTLYEQGCCCDPKQLRYTDGKLVNSCKAGYLYLCQDRDGNTIDELTRLVALD